MTDADDKLSRRYREASREEPPAHLDAAILAASRRAVGARPGARKPSWMVPASIAAVLVLGIGVSLRMQLEQPGIESAAPAESAEYPLPAATEPAPATPLAEPALRAPPAPPAKAEPEVKRRAQAEARRETQPAAKRDDLAASKAMVQPAQPVQPAQAPAPQAAPRAKVEGFAADAAQERAALGAAADPDPARELERIARLREAASHAEADRALEAFRRRHPDYRIPEAMWDRVKPR